MSLMYRFIYEVSPAVKGELPTFHSTPESAVTKFSADREEEDNLSNIINRSVLHKAVLSLRVGDQVKVFGDTIKKHMLFNDA